MKPKVPLSVQKWGTRLAGLSAGAVPGIGDPAGHFIKSKLRPPHSTWLGQGLKGSMGLGAGLALDQYHQRWGLGNMGARGLENISFGMYKAPETAWDNSPKASWDNRGVQATTKTERVGRFGDGPPSLSQRTRKSPRFGKKRRRCKHRNKAGKRCLRPAGHSGRHRYQ